MKNNCSICNGTLAIHDNIFSISRSCYSCNYTYREYKNPYGLRLKLGIPNLRILNYKGSNSVKLCEGSFEECLRIFKVKAFI